MLLLYLVFELLFKSIKYVKKRKKLNALLTFIYTKTLASTHLWFLITTKSSSNTNNH